jgi:hypothetical protein
MALLRSLAGNGSLPSLQCRGIFPAIQGPRRPRKCPKSVLLVRGIPRSRYRRTVGGTSPMNRTVKACLQTGWSNFQSKACCRDPRPVVAAAYRR